MNVVAIRLQDRGFDDELIVVALGTDSELGPPLMRIATKKVATPLEEGGGSLIDLAEPPPADPSARPRRGA